MFAWQDLNRCSWIDPENGANRGRPAIPIPVRRLTEKFIVAVAFAALFGFSSIAIADDSIVGFVLDVSGTWVVATGKKNDNISGGDKLVAGAVIRPTKVDKDSFLRVCLFDGTTIDYRKETKLPSPVKESTVSRICSAVAGRYRGGVVQAVSRGNEFLTDGVVLLKEGQAEISSLLEDLPDGKWILRFRQQTNSVSTQAQTKAKGDDLTVTVNWSSGESANIEVAGLKAGIYELQVLNSRTKRPVGQAAIVLFSKPDTYETQLESYREAQKLTESWSEEIRESAAVPFLRAYLEDLTSSDQ